MKKILSWITKVWPTVLAGVKKGAAVIVTGAVWLLAKIKTVKWSQTKTEVVRTVLLLAAMTAVVILAKHKQQPAATANKTTIQKVVENPTVKQTQTADTTAITEQSIVRVTGTAKRTGATVKVPVSGTAKTTYIDSKTKEQVGEGSHEVTGETTVTVRDETVTADTVINDNNEVAVTTGRITRKNEFGG
jgi:hypothetical protein